MRAMNIFRYIRAANPTSVVEFGPGSGYLGLLHILGWNFLYRCREHPGFLSAAEPHLVCRHRGKVLRTGDRAR